jgi:hypothetical protein
MSALRKRRYEPAPEPSRLGSMSFLEHLEEFRRRIIKAGIGIAVGMAVAFLFIDRLMSFVLEPARRMLPARPSRAITRYSHLTWEYTITVGGRTGSRGARSSGLQAQHLQAGWRRPARLASANLALPTLCDVRFTW